MTTEKIKDIMKDNFVFDNSFYNKVSMIAPFGKLLFNKETDNNLFDTLDKLPDNEIVGLAEKPFKIRQFVVDFDLKVKTDKIQNLYKEDLVMDLIKTFRDTFIECITDCNCDWDCDCEKIDKTCVYLTKPPYKSGSYVKNGFHLQFPNMCLFEKDIRELTKLVEERMKKNWEGFELDDVSSKPWLLYRSRKSVDSDIYKVEKVFDDDFDEVIYENVNWTKLLSIQNKGTWIDRNRIKLPQKSKPSLSKTKIYKDKSNTKIQEDIERIVPRLGEHISKDWNSWFAIGSLIKKYFGLTQRGLDLFLDFSRKCVDKFDEYECEKMYKKTDEDNNYTIGTLFYYYKM